MYQWVEPEMMVKRISDGAFIGAPASGFPPNRDWIAFKEWRAAGNEPQPPAPRSPQALAGDIERASRFTLEELRDIAIAALPEGHPIRVKAETVKSTIDKMRSNAG